MPLGIENVNILIHGLFFMTLNPATNNLEIFAPNISDHHFVGGVRGARKELSKKVNLTGLGLEGKVIKDPQHPPTIDDVPGTIFQFLRSETGVGDFKIDDPTKFKGSIILPWPQKFIAFRQDKVETFRYVPTSNIGSKVELASRRKGGGKLGVGALLQYTISTVSSIDWASLVNIHFYLQPCQQHDLTAVNDDLSTAANCFTNPDAFDLQMIVDSNQPTPVDATGDASLGTTAEDEQSLDEENLSPDIQLICPPNPVSVATETQINPQVPAVSPANCPLFFVG